MKHVRIFSLIALVAALTTVDVQAQDTRIGLGVGVTGVSSGAAAIYVPIDFGSFRIEPEFGLRRFSSEQGDVEASETSIILGTGVFAEGATVANTVIYYGGRVGIARYSESIETPAGDNDESVTDLFLGPAVGAEYYFSERFSLGGEAQLMFTAIGQEDDDDDGSASLLQTGAILFVRWYF